MTRKHMEYFLTVLKFQNLSLAAENLFISRQALSKIIREMEKELGYQLFVRSKNGVRPTDEGLQVAQHLSVIKEEYDRMLNQVEKHEQKEINVLAFDDIIEYLSADFIIAFSEKYPDILLHFIEGTDINAHDMLMLHKCDAAIVPDSIDVTKFENVFLFHSQYGVLVNCENPLYGNEVVSFADLQKQRVIGKNRELLYYQNDLKYILAQGGKINFSAEVSDNFIAIELVKKNFGIAFAWDYCIKKYIDEKIMKFIPLMKEGWGRDIYFIKNSEVRENKDKAQIVKCFEKFLVEWVQMFNKIYSAQKNNDSK